MRRIVSALVVCTAVGASAAPAFADNSGTPPGPPATSGNPNGATVLHCKAPRNGAGRSVVVFNNNGQSGGGNCIG
jgi:hypothetical protein